ncbi:hypothetical protein [Sphingomonas sp. 28-63-12]|uniref:hypothetical protein n=1 Tax=Sphingomonas sp. 28-63-12 TaxID=1970434 RepID=UPI000BDA9208|nr:MAG: hypothetical protein B7Y47_00165 [Sphingomonas sp. 28-63-12]
MARRPCSELAIGADDLFGTGIATIIVIAVVLWRIDNAVGAFLLLVVLVLIVAAILALLTGALAYLHRLMAG